MFPLEKNDLTPAQRRIATYFEHSPEQALLQTEQAIAETLNISNATVSRFFKQIGYNSYKTFKQAYAERTMPLPQNKVQHLIDSKHSTPVRFQKILEQLYQTEHALTPQQLERLLSILLRADQIHIFSFGVSKGLGELLFYRLRRIGLNVRLHTEGGSEMIETLLHINECDAVILFSFSRLIAETKALLTVTEKKRSPVIAITDHEALAHEKAINLALTTDRGKPHEYHSMIGPLYLIERLVEALIKETDASSIAEELVELRRRLKYELPR